jgi:TonB family protein
MPAPQDRFLLAVLAAVTLHLLSFWIAAGGPRSLIAGFLPPPTAASKQIGDTAGSIEGISAEVIDAAEFDRKYVSFRAGKDAEDSETPAASAKPAERPAEPQPQAKPEDRLETSALPAPPPEGRRPEPPQERPVFSAAEIERIVSGSVQDIQGVVVAIEKAGAAKLGEASPYVRSVVRKLKETMPRKPGLKGTVTVQFLISPAGSVEAARIARSSGVPELDRLVLERIITTKFAQPASTTTQQERKFQISYEYN